MCKLLPFILFSLRQRAMFMRNNYTDDPGLFVKFCNNFKLLKTRNNIKQKTRNFLQAKSFILIQILITAIYQRNFSWTIELIPIHVRKVPMPPFTINSHFGLTHGEHIEFTIENTIFFLLCCTILLDSNHWR